jgi:hypothetical protein
MRRERERNEIQAHSFPVCPVAGLARRSGRGAAVDSFGAAGTPGAGRSSDAASVAGELPAGSFPRRPRIASAPSSRQRTGCGSAPAAVAADGNRAVIGGRTAGPRRVAGAEQRQVGVEDGDSIRWRLWRAGSFSRFRVASGAVWVYSEDRSQVFGPYTGSGIDPTGDFWSHTVFADTVVVEYLADQRAETVPFSITRIAHLMASEQTMSAGTCELDVTCYSPWGSIASGVGMYIFESGGRQPMPAPGPW